MDHHIGLGGAHGLADRVGVQRVSYDRARSQLLQQRPLRVRARHSRHLVAPLHEARDQLLAEGAGSARYEDLHLVLLSPPLYPWDEAARRPVTAGSFGGGGAGKDNTVYELPDDVRALVEGANYAHVATLLPDGSPHSVPVWIGLEGDRVAFLTGPGSRKARNLERDPRVAFSITDRDQPFSMAGIRGRVVDRLEDDAAFVVIDRLSQQYIGQSYPERTDRVVYLVEPEHAWALDYG
jgi:PPOX class probable F420-dependent enzyme